MLTTPEGALAAGAPECVGLISAALVARITGNHILSLTAGMASFWLLGWLL
ncbi:MAG: AzlD domain-containing protein [Pseudomonadota bacterium]|nr:AzlD domain-containing protein [Pseudomonadota bacterium]